MVGFPHPSVHVMIMAVQGLIHDNTVSHLLARQDVSPVKTASGIHVTLYKLAKVMCMVQQ